MKFSPLSSILRRVAPRVAFELEDARRARREAKLASRSPHAATKFQQRQVLVDLAKGRVVVDVGAHKGLYCFEVMRHAKRVIAFEPNPKLAEGLGARVRGTGYLVEVHCLALSDHKGTAQLRVPTRRPGSATLDADNLHVQRIAKTEEVELIDVELTPLDALSLGTLDVMKIDVEGHQLPLIAGAQQTLLRDKPDLFIEIDESHREGAIAEVDARLRELGYQGFFLLGPVLLPMALFSRRLLHNRANGSQGKVRVNDFFYFHTSKLAEATQRLANIVFYPPAATATLDG